MLSVIFDVTGDEAVEHRLLGLSLRATDFRPVLTVIAGQMRSSMAERFDEGQGNWAPLAPSTVLYKSRNDLDPRILHATLDMRRSFTEKDDAGHYEIMTEDELIFGSSDPKAPLHASGTVNMPARPPMDFGSGELRNFSREIQAYLVGLEGPSNFPVWLK